MPSLVTAYGSTSFALPDRRVRSRRDDLNEVTQTFQRSSATAFAIGDAFPGMTGYVVEEITRVDECVETGAECYLYELRGVGIGPTARKLSYSESVNEEGWDTVNVRWLTSNKQLVQLGDALSGALAMRAVGVEREEHPSTSAFWYVSASYRGMIQPKNPKIRWTQNGRELSKDQLIVALPGGWTDPRKAEILWPRAGCTISYVTLDLPATGVPQQTGDAPHPQAPFVVAPSIFGDPAEFLWHWPNGWTLQGVEADVIPGSSIAFITENWIFNHEVTLG